MSYNPVPGSRTSATYGQSGPHWSANHTGIDFAAPAGTTFHAAMSGQVISVGWGGVYGNLMKVRQDDGSIAYYAHAQGFYAKVGDRVKRGTALGQVGSTGNSTGPHLHFEVRVDGRHVDPTRYLQGRDPGTHAPGGPVYGGGGFGDTFTEGERDNSALMEALGLGEDQPQAAHLATRGGGFALAGNPLDEGGLGDESGPTSLMSMLEGEAGFNDRANQSNLQHDPFERQLTPRAPQPPQFHAPLTPQSNGDSFTKLRNAIASQESGGNYSAVNSSSGALGKYQIMPANIASWSRAALGYSITPQQFLRDPQLQEKIASHRLGTYYQKYGAAGAALAWYAGEGALKYSSATLNRPQGGGAYPSMNSYVQQVLRRAGL